MNSMKKVIVTGPTGVIGIALIEELIKNGIEITVVCHPHSIKNSYIPKTELVKIIECDLDELFSLTEILEHDYDVFYHFAWICTTIRDARNNVDAQMKNIQYTLDAVEVAATIGCKRFVGAGSQAEYGRYTGMLNSTTPAFPDNGYGIAKLCAGQMSRLRCQQLGIEHIWARILSVYGPYDGEQTMIISIIRQLLNGNIPKCTAGEQIWDYIFSKDAAKAFYLIGQLGKTGKTYCIGSGTGIPLKDYINEVKNQINKNLEIHFGDIPYSDNQIMYLCADISELQKDTGFKPEYSFETGIKETIEWCKKNHLQKDDSVAL